MERSGKLADLKLVSKYYPIANYSYPRPDRHGAHDGITLKDRSSLGSDGSAPGLIEDRTESETSNDDDYQYHTHGSEIWDSFWLSDSKAERRSGCELHPKKHYPALISSPQQKKRQDRDERRSTAWPLPESPRPRNRKAAAAYAPIPKPLSLPARTSSLVPTWQLSRPKGKPRRPPRPDDELLEACVQQPSPVTAHFATSPDPNKSSFSRPVTPLSPLTPLTPIMPADNRPSTSMEVRPATPMDIRRSACSEISRSTTDLPLRDYQPMVPMTPVNKTVTARPVVQHEPEPQSVFEYDDSDLEEPHGLPFFRFHKRADSEVRKRAKKNETCVRPRRARANTEPSSPGRSHSNRTSKQEAPGRKRQTDVFVRMLRRSRG